MHRTCAHPGCTVGFDSCRIHHIRWWTRDLGPTDIDNLLPLCETHHHLVHEGGWTLTMTPDRVATWTRPDGTIWITTSTVDRAIDIVRHLDRPGATMSRRKAASDEPDTPPRHDGGMSSAPTSPQVREVSSRPEQLTLLASVDRQPSFPALEGHAGAWPSSHRRDSPAAGRARRSPTSGLTAVASRPAQASRWATGRGRPASSSSSGSSGMIASDVVVTPLSKYAWIFARHFGRPIRAR